MDGLIDFAVKTDISGGGESESSDESRAEVGDDVSVEIGHDHDIELGGLVGELHADCIDLFFPILNRGVVIGNLMCGFDEETITHLHYTGLVTGNYRLSS